MESVFKDEVFGEDVKSKFLQMPAMMIREGKCDFSSVVSGDDLYLVFSPP